MLSRTADHLFWMARYTERAENTARMLDVNVQTALLPQSAEATERGWRAMLGISELQEDFDRKYPQADRARRDRLHGARPGQPVLHRLLPGQRPRECARGARHADDRSLGNPQHHLAGRCRTSCAATA